MYPRVKVRATEVDDDDYGCSVIPLQDFNSLSIRDYSPEKEHKYLSVAKVPRSYFPRSITPPALPKAARNSNKQAENNGKQHIRASSIPRPRAVISSPDNDQILGNRIKMRLERPSAMRNQNTARRCIHLAQSKPSDHRSPPSTTTLRKPNSKAAVESKVTTQKTDIANKGNNGSAVDIRVPRANILKAKPCFTIT